MKKKYVLFAAILSGCRLFAPEKSDAVAKTTDGGTVSLAVTQNSAKVSPNSFKRSLLTSAEMREARKNQPPLPSLDSSEDDDEQEEIGIRIGEIIKKIIYSKGEQKKIMRRFCHEGVSGKDVIDGCYIVDDPEGLDLEKYTRQALFLAFDKTYCIYTCHKLEIKARFEKLYEEDPSFCEQLVMDSLLLVKRNKAL